MSEVEALLESAEQTTEAKTAEVAEQAEPAKQTVQAEVVEQAESAEQTSQTQNPEQAEQQLQDQPSQSEMPFAMVQGQPFTKMPEDLYIPPDALEVILEAFEGPLDLLLYLIRRQNLEILDISIASITQQYVDYIEMMSEMRLELAAEYLVMAAMLAEIKSRMLLPRVNEGEEDEDDPRANLIRRLQEYERYKNVAEELDVIPRQGREVFDASANPPDMKLVKPLPEVDLKDLILAFNGVMKRIQVNAKHHIQLEPLSIRERMTEILSAITSDNFTTFESLFSVKEGRSGVVVTFIAILELAKQSMIEIVQSEPFSPIHVRAAA